MFNKHKAKATFFVSHFYSLDTEQINKLKTLELDGSEIGCHTYNHKGVTQDFNNDVNRISEYIEEQIKVPYDQMQASGFNPVSFAYPYGEHQVLYDEAVRAYFPYIRLTFDNFENALATQADIYHNSNDNYIVLSGAGIDKDFNNALSEITEALIQARKTGNIITFYAHDVVNDLNQPYNILPQTLEKIIESANNFGLKFYTNKEAYQIGNQN
jgi:peptidoglycan/xylan/chitin deacetylase (PgdA/CDA1 family)